MVQCDNCGTEVDRLWMHRSFDETMTHRTVEWVCDDCHPELPTTVANRPDREPAKTDGGRSA